MSGSIYPSAIDNTSTLPTVVDLNTPVAATTVNILRNTLITVEAELGVKPSGIFGTVRARLDALDAQIAAIIAGGGGGGGSGSVIFAGDLAGTNTHQVVVGLYTRPLSAAAPTVGQTIIWDGYIWSPSTNFLGAEIISGPALSTSDTTGLIELTGKFVVNGIPTSSLISDPGQAIIYFDSDIGKLLISENGGPYFELFNEQVGGDLDGYLPNPTVVKIQHNPVSSELLGVAEDGYVLTWDNADGYWVARPTTTEVVDLFGDVTGTTVNSKVVTVSGGGLTVATAGSSKLELNAGFAVNVTNITGSYGVLTTDYLISVGAISGIITVTLPASPSKGDAYEIKDANGNAATFNITIDGNGKNIDGASTYVMATNFQAVLVCYNGAQWSVI